MVAGYAAKELVSLGLRSGELAIVSADSAVPYERPPLSKGFLSGKDEEGGILINPPVWYREHGIEVRLNTLIEHVDPSKKRMRSNAGEEFECEHMLLATGARARKLDCPGNKLGNVFYLRSLKDSETIRSSSAGAKQAVIIGGGFIGMEVASVLAQKNIQSTLVIREDRVWSRVFTPAMSAFFEHYYTAHGVRVLKQAHVAAFEGKNRVQAVLLGDGEKLPCDFVVAGVGAVPVTELFEKAGIAVDDGIVVNEYLEATGAGIYAAGDVANYKASYTAAAFADTVLTGETIRQRLTDMTVLVAVDPFDHVIGTIAYRCAVGGEGHIRGMALCPERHGSGVAQRK